MVPALVLVVLAVFEAASGGTDTADGGRPWAALSSLNATDAPNTGC